MSILNLDLRSVNMNSLKPHSCSKCGRAFARRYDLGRHVELVHADDASEEELDSDETTKSEDEKEKEVNEDDEVEEMDDVDLEDNPSYREWVDQAREETREMWNDKYEKYVNEGMSEELAKGKANRKTSWDVKRLFFNKYGDFLFHYFNLKDDETHQEIEYEVDKKVKNGVEIVKALKRVMPKHRVKFEGLFLHDGDESAEESSELDEDGEQ